MSRKNHTAAGLWAIVNLMQITLNITHRRLSEAERMSLTQMRKAKLVQDISISRTRQEVLTTNLNINVRRSSHKIEQDIREVELDDLKIEMQKLKVLEMRKKLGITDSEFEALSYNSAEFSESAGLQRYEDRPR